MENVSKHKLDIPSDQCPILWYQRRAIHTQAYSDVPLCTHCVPTMLCCFYYPLQYQQNVRQTVSNGIYSNQSKTRIPLLSFVISFYPQMGLSLEDLLRMFVCSETVDAVECHGCRQQQSTDESASAVRTTFIKRLTLGKVTEFCI